MLTLQDLHIGFPGTKRQKEVLLFKVDQLKFAPNELVGLIGPNGSGKTTFFNNLLGFQKPIAGKIYWEGKEINQLGAKERVKTMSFVPSQFHGVDNLKVYDLIAMGRSPYTNLLDKLTEKDREIINQIISKMGLKDLVHKSTVSLSDGERQIAMIGKAMAQKSHCMILDEPTAFLDFNNRRKMLQLLHEIAQAKQQLLFISSHNLDLCFKYCNRIVGVNAKEKRLVNYFPPFQPQEVIKQIFGE